MKLLASLLLVIVAVTHYGHDLLALLHDDPAAAARAWFYVLRGFEGCVLFLVIWLLTARSRSVARYGVAAACAWGAFEEAQTSICRLAVGIDHRVPPPGLFRGICEDVYGVPLYMLTASVVLVLATRFIGRETPP